MIDSVKLEKAKKGLNCCGQMSGAECLKCPYGDECISNDLAGMAHLAADALSLLEVFEQENRVVNDNAQ